MSTEGFPINEAGARKTDFALGKIIYIFYPTQILLQKTCSISSWQLFLSNMRIIFNAQRKENILVAKIPILPCA